MLKSIFKISKGFSKFLFGLSLFVFSSSPLFAQSFLKNHFVIENGLGIANYNVNIQIDEELFDRNSGAFILESKVEYALLNQVGAGLIFQRTLYAMNDTSTLKRIASNSNSLLFSNNLHLINLKELDVSFSIAYGLGNFNQQFVAGRRTNSVDVIKGLGINYLVNLNFRIFPTNELGLYFCITGTRFFFDIYEYKQNGEEIPLPSHLNQTINLRGFNLTGGILIRPGFKKTK
jgi:hypothetical protein